MKLLPSRRILFPTLALLLLAACTPTQVERKEGAAATMRGAATDVRATRAQTDRTLSALDAVLSAPPEQLKQAYDNYSAEVDKMGKAARKTGDSAATVRKMSDEYVAQWQKTHAEISNPELKATSEQRRTETMNAFGRMQASFDAAKQDFLPFMRNLQDVKTVLSTDLTPAGVKSLAGTDVVKNAHATGAQVAKDLDNVIAEFDGVANQLSPTAQ